MKIIVFSLKQMFIELNVSKVKNKENKLPTQCVEL